MIYFVDAGSGAPDLITVRGARLLSEADVIVYAGSLVNPALLDYKKDGCEVYNSAKMTLEEVIAVMAPAAKARQNGLVCTPATRACTVRIESRWTSWTGSVWRMRFVRACLRSAARQRTQSRVHTAEREPVGHPDAYGGPHARARKGADRVVRGTRSHHGHLPVGGSAGAPCPSG